MERQMIVTGDTLAPRGGEVLDGSHCDNVDGKKIARMGDPVRCIEHGINEIAEGDESTLVGDKPVALEGHRAKCGCTLVSARKTMSVS